VAPAALPRASATVATTITATATTSVSQPACPGRADRDEDRSAESKQDGDIRLRHRRPPVVLDKNVGKSIAKGVGAGCGDLFE